MIMSFVKMLSKLRSVVLNRSAVCWKSSMASLSSPPIAIVTGGARGIGFTICEQLLLDGYKVCLVDEKFPIGESSFDELKAKFGSGNVIFSEIDVTNSKDFKTTFSDVNKIGQISLLVNNAGIVDEYYTARTVDVNLMATITGCQLALKYMGTQAGGKGGTVINIGSIPSFLPYPRTPCYVATKHGIIGLTRSYGHESHFKQNGVIFAAMCPSYVDTSLLRTAKPLEYIEHNPEMTFVKPETIGAGIAKLLKDKINGSVLLVLPDRMEYAEIPDQMKNIPFSY